MATEPGRTSAWTTHFIVYGGAVIGLVLLVLAFISDAPPRWWWWYGGGLTVICGGLALIWGSFRWRQRLAEGDMQAVEGPESLG